MRAAWFGAAVAVWASWSPAGTAGAAGTTACPEHFASGEPPVLVNPKLASRTHALCYSGYAVLFSGLTRTPLWSAEHLTAERVGGARGQDRVNSFHTDPGLPVGERSELSDYVRSGYDRGHMAPSGDMPDSRSQDESFSLANMIPQDPDNNRHLWAGIESGIRDLASQEGELYVVTGPVFSGESVQSLKGRVLIPTHLYKAVYDVRRHAAAAYLVENAPGREAKTVSLSELQEVTGLAPFPGLSKAIKDRALALPMPGHGRARPPVVAGAPPARQDPATTGSLVDTILEDIDNLPRRP